MPCSNLFEIQYPIYLYLDQKKAFIRHNSSVLNHLINKTAITDSLKYSYSFLWGYGHFSPVTVGYENLKSIGVSLIKDDLLRNEISELYENTYFDIALNIRPSIQAHQEIHANQIVSKIKHQELYVNAEPINLQLLQHDLQFQESLKWTVFARKWTNERYEEGILEIKKVLEQIEKELNK